MKPADAIVQNGAIIPYPTQTANLHYEIELVVAIGTGGKDIAEADSFDHVWGYGVGIDLTRRIFKTRPRRWGAPGTWAKDLIIQRHAHRSARYPLSATRQKVPFG